MSQLCVERSQCFAPQISAGYHGDQWSGHRSRVDVSGVSRRMGP